MVHQCRDRVRGTKRGTELSDRGEVKLGMMIAAGLRETRDDAMIMEIYAIATVTRSVQIWEYQRIW